MSVSARGGGEPDDECEHSGAARDECHEGNHVGAGRLIDRRAHFQPPESSLVTRVASICTAGLSAAALGLGIAVERWSTAASISVLLPLWIWGGGVDDLRQEGHGFGWVRRGGPMGRVGGTRARRHTRVCGERSGAHGKSLAWAQATCLIKKYYRP